jgi:hypothetical protein
MPTPKRNRHIQRQRKKAQQKRREDRAWLSRQNSPILLSSAPPRLRKLLTEGIRSGDFEIRGEKVSKV